MATSSPILRSMRILASAMMVAAITLISYSLHAQAFVAGLLFLLLILPIAFQWGFLEATVASVMAIACLDYFFTKPALNFNMSDPQDWVALSAFEIVVLVVSRLAKRLRHHADQAVSHQASVDRLYTMSRELLLIDRGEPVGAQLARLIAEVFELPAVAVWNAHTAKLDVAGTQPVPEAELFTAGQDENPKDDPARGKFVRALALGSRPLGALYLVCGDAKGSAKARIDARIDARTADAIASLVAIAMERERAFLAESSATASRQTERLRSAVLDGLAHTLKTPLATIQTASSGLLEMHRLDAIEEELVATIQREAEHLADLTTQALQTAKSDAAQVRVQRQRILVQPFLQTDWSRLAQGLESHSLEICNLDQVCFVWADPRLLQMALAQFLDNAAKYAEPASPISMRVTVTDSETIFSVHNDGSYIAPEERENIFQRFYRTRESRYRAPGTGIGLAVAKQIAEAHRGRVWTESEPELGTTFFLGLPHIVREAR
jgi:two-component system sensor histidine kinase KdpD